MLRQNVQVVYDYVVNPIKLDSYTREALQCGANVKVLSLTA